MTVLRKSVGVVGRADLLRALAAGDDVMIARVANQLGLESIALSVDDTADLEIDLPLGQPLTKTQTAETGGQPDTQKEYPTAAFWLLKEREVYEQQDDDSAKPQTISAAPITWEGRPQQKPTFYPLIEQRDFIPQITPYLQHGKMSLKPDIPCLVNKVSKAEPFIGIPREYSKSLNTTVQVIDDRHAHLVTYWQDHDRLRCYLRALVQGAVQEAVLMDGQFQPRVLNADPKPRWFVPQPGATVFILSDLGALSDKPEQQIKTWLVLGQAIQRVGARAIVLLPCDPVVCDQRLGAYFTLQLFDVSASNRQVTVISDYQRAIENLLTVLSPVIRLEPGLLRQMRLSMRQHGRAWQIDAVVEARLWQHPAIQDGHSVAASWQRDARQDYLKKFTVLSEAERITALEVIRQWRQPLSQRIWFEEIASLDEVSKGLITDDVQVAEAYFRQLAQQVQSDAFLASETDTCEWLQRVVWRMPDVVLQDDVVGEVLQRIKFKVSPELSGVDPRKLSSADFNEKALVLYQQGESLMLDWPGAADGDLLTRSPLGEIRARQGFVRVEVGGERYGEVRIGESLSLPDMDEVDAFSVVSDLETLYFERLEQPEWSSRIWQDQDGVFVETRSEGGDTYKWEWYPGERSEQELKSKRGSWYLPKVEVVDTVTPINKVFISYARDGGKGEKLAGETHEYLQGMGFEVFHDATGLKPGDVWHKKLEAELISSDAMVLVISEKARGSEWLYNEFLLAQNVGIPVIPVLAENIRLSSWLKHLKSLDFTEILDWDLLVKCLSKQNFAKIMPSPEWSRVVGHDQYGFYSDLTINDVIQRFRWVEPGSFMMGSPKSEEGRWDNEDLHHVTLIQGFWLADTAVTQEAWKVVMNETPSYFKGDLNLPVEQVNWNDCQGFIQKINDDTPGLGLRFPTERQWEYACRAGTNTPFYFGEKNDLSLKKVNYSGRWKEHDFNGETKPVKSSPPNDWGFYEIHGNTYEWCEDLWYENLGFEPVVEPMKQVPGQKKSWFERVVRGGAWISRGRRCRSASRRGVVPHTYDYDIGFRLCMDMRPIKVAQDMDWTSIADDSDSHTRTFWEEQAYQAVESLLDSAEVNKEDKTVFFYEKKVFSELVSNYDELVIFLASVAENECAANAPRDGREFVFDWDGSGIAESAIFDHPTQLHQFFDE